jgi:hypothetical protein
MTKISYIARIEGGTVRPSTDALECCRSDVSPSANMVDASGIVAIRLASEVEDRGHVNTPRRNPQPSQTTARLQDFPRQRALPESQASGGQSRE